MRFDVKISCNKKVLLRERKRHTARRVASTPYVVLTGYPPGQGTPPARVPPSQGTPLARVPPSQGTPPARVPPLGYPPTRVSPPPGYPPGWIWQGTPPWLTHGILGNVAKHYGIWVSPPLWTDRLMDGWKDRRVSKYYLPVVLRTTTGGNYLAIISGNDTEKTDSRLV